MYKKERQRLMFVWFFFRNMCFARVSYLAVAILAKSIKINNVANDGLNIFNGKTINKRFHHRSLKYPCLRWVCCTEVLAKPQLFGVNHVVVDEDQNLPLRRRTTAAGATPRTLALLSRRPQCCLQNLHLMPISSLCQQCGQIWELKVLQVPIWSLRRNARR